MCKGLPEPMTTLPLAVPVTFDFPWCLWQVTGLFTNEVHLLVLRCCELLFFTVTLVVEGTTGSQPAVAPFLVRSVDLEACVTFPSGAGDGFGDPRLWLTFFTNWTFVLFGLWAVLGVCLSAQHLQVWEAHSSKGG